MSKEIKKQLSKLFVYDFAANQTLLQLIDGNAAPKRIVELFAHLASSQLIWLTRCKNQELGDVAVWPDWDLPKSIDVLQSNHSGWTNFVESLEDQELDTVVYYKNSKGERHRHFLGDIIMHVINHGTHHRAQIGMLLKECRDLTLPYTDYIYFAEQQNKSLGE